MLKLSSTSPSSASFQTSFSWSYRTGSYNIYTARGGGREGLPWHSRLKCLVLIITKHFILILAFIFFNCNSLKCLKRGFWTKKRENFILYFVSKKVKIEKFSYKSFFSTNCHFPMKEHLTETLPTTSMLDPDLTDTQVGACHKNSPPPANNYHQDLTQGFICKSLNTSHFPKFHSLKGYFKGAPLDGKLHQRDTGHMWSTNHALGTSGLEHIFQKYSGPELCLMLGGQDICFACPLGKRSGTECLQVFSDIAACASYSFTHSFLC